MSFPIEAAWSAGYAKPIFLLAIGSAVALATITLSRPASEPARGPVAVPSQRGRAPERLLPDTLPPRGPATLLFLEGRPSQPGGSGHERLAMDGAGGVLSIDARLRVSRPRLQLDGREATSVAPARSGGLWLTDATGDLIRVDARGRLVFAGPTPFAYPAVAGDPSSGDIWMLRSAQRFAYQPEAVDAPLLIRFPGGRGGQGQRGSGSPPGTLSPRRSRERWPCRGGGWSGVLRSVHSGRGGRPHPDG